MKKWKAGLLILSVVVLAFAYIARVVYVNRNNGLTKVTYLSDDEAVTYNGLELTVEEEKLYDIAAFIEEYPQIQKYYKYEGSMYERYDDEEGLRAIEYKLCVKLNFKNVTDKIQQIPLVNYEVYSGAYSNGFYVGFIEELNQLSGDETLGLAPKESRSLLISYDLSRLSFRSDHYENLLEQPFSILISGYPHIQNISLTHLEYVQADEEAQEVYERLVSADRTKQVSEIKDTEYGTMLELGEQYVKNGITVEVEDCQVVRNVNDYPEYDSSAFSTEESEEILEEDGTLAAYKWNGEVVEEETYLVFVKLKCTNVTNQVKLLKLYPFLHNYSGKKSNDLCYKKQQAGNADGEGSFEEQLQSGEIRYVTYGYHVRVNTDKWKFPDGALYLEFSGMSSRKTDIRKGTIAMPQVYLRVQ